MYTLVEVALSVGVLVTLITALSICVCGCKNSNQKASTQNSQRSLPEIPHPVGRHDSGDTASEIYATVNLDEGNKNVVTASTSRDHSYEHAYAKLQNEPHNIIVEVTPDQRSDSEIQIDEREATSSAPESVVISASVAISGQLPSSQELPYITPPSPRPHESNAHFSGDSTDSTKGYTSISVREPLSNIRAQSNKTQLQPHYATVSDDSDEMYAAIEEASAGEGSDTYAQIAPSPRRRPPPAPSHALPPAQRPDLIADATPHDRRSAPPEIVPSTSNSTHSRQASSSSCSNSTGALGSPKPEKRQANSPLPPPPAVPHAAPAASHAAPAAPAQPHSDPHRHHHRISSTGDLFAQEKLRRSLNEKHQRNNSCVSSSDFYGCNYPVEKHRFSSGDPIRPLVAKELNFDIDQKENRTDNLYNSIEGSAYSDYSSAEVNDSMTLDQRTTESPSRNLDDMYAKVMKRAKGKDESVRRSKDLTNTGEKYRGDDPGYETIDRNKSASHGYETIAHKGTSQDPGYETVKEVKSFANNNLHKLNHVASDSGPNSIISSDAGYEHILKKDNASDSDPNYEVLRNQTYATIPPTYSAVNKKSKYEWVGNNNEPTASTEPNYESMPHDQLYNTGSESDPNYESVRPKDQNYESVNMHDPNYESLRCKDPKYESVRSKTSKKDPNYESVKYFDLAKEPPYEKVAGVERTDSSAGYEKINIANNRDPKSSVNGEGTVSDYFQV